MRSATSLADDRIRRPVATADSVPAPEGAEPPPRLAAPCGAADQDPRPRSPAHAETRTAGPATVFAPKGRSGARCCSPLPRRKEGRTCRKDGGAQAFRTFRSDNSAPLARHRAVLAERCASREVSAAPDEALRAALSPAAEAADAASTGSSSALSRAGKGSREYMSRTRRFAVGEVISCAYLGTYLTGHTQFNHKLIHRYCRSFCGGVLSTNEL